MKNIRLKNIVSIIVFITISLNVHFSVQPNGIKAKLGSEVFAYSDTKTVDFPKGTSRSRSKKIHIPNLVSVTDISVNTGSVSKSINGDYVTISVSGGRYVDSYTPSKYKDIVVNTGEEFPDSNYRYSSGGYFGYLQRYDEEDKGDYKTLQKSASQERSNTVTRYYDADGNLLRFEYSWDNSNDHPSIEYTTSDGYSGTLYKGNVTAGPESKNTNDDGSYTIRRTYYATYTGTVKKEVWEADWVGYYRGYVYGSTTYYYAYTVTLNYIANSSPAISVISPSNNDIYSESDVSFVPTVSVSDPNGDLLTCKYYIDSNSTPEDTRQVTNSSTTQLISFDAIDTSSLSEGSHTIKFTVKDDLNTVASTVNIYVDRSAPTINNLNLSSTDTSITASGSASDSSSGLHATPYRYSFDDAVGEWTTNAACVKNNITPNTNYSIKFEARDKVEHVSSKSHNIYTKAQTPDLSLVKNDETSIVLLTTDANPAATEYQISTPVWIKLVDKKIEVKGLTPNTTYYLEAKARNDEKIETNLSNRLKVTTLSPPPSGITFELQRTSIKMSWKAVTNAKAYYLKVDGNINPINLGTNTTYTHENLNPDTLHTYSIVVENDGGMGRWSEVFEKTTLPNPPDLPNIIDITSDQTTITLFWDSAARAVGYSVKLGNNNPIDAGLVNTYTITDLTADTEYSLALKAYNRGGESNLTETVNKFTLPYLPDTPEGIEAVQTTTTVTVTWQSAERTQWYEIMVDGLITDVGTNLEFLHEGLEPASGHTYKIRACNIGGKSPWSEPVDITTYPEAPAVPTNVMATSQTDSITITWYRVPYGEEYEVEIDGSIYITTTDTSFVHMGLGADERHSYRVRVRNISGESPWSSPIVMYTMPEITSGGGDDGEENDIALTNVVAVVTNNNITISWDAAEYMAEYILEVDDMVIDNGQNTIFNHTNLEPDTYHIYKIRIKDENSTNRWCAILSLSTMPNPPNAPDNIETFATHNQIEIKWDRVDGVEGYDIEINGKVMDIKDATVYMHENLEPGTSHTYRIRAKNISGVTAWSPAITENTLNPTSILECRDGELVELSLIAMNIQDFSELEFRVEYNSEELELVDLCGFTPGEDRIREGDIIDTNLSVIYKPGTIIFTVDKTLVPGTSWTGEITNLVFKANKDGETCIDFIMN